MTTISKTVAATTPQAPNQLAARMPTSVATTSWQISTSSRTGLRKPCGFSTSRTRTLAPRRPSSTRAMALARLVRTRLVSARARSGRDAERGAPPRATRRRDERGRDRRSVSGQRWTEPVPRHRCARDRPVTRPPGRTGQQLLLAPLHPLGLVVDLVVHAEEVEEAVHDQQGDLVVEADPVLDGVAGGHRRADDHVARGGSAGRVSASMEPGPVPPSSGDRPPRSDSSSMGKDSTSVGPLLAEEALVERGDGGLVDEEERHLGVAHRRPRRRAPSGPATTTARRSPGGRSARRRRRRQGSSRTAQGCRSRS